MQERASFGATSSVDIPVDRFLSVFLQGGIRFREAFAAEEFAGGQRRRMGGLDHRVFGRVDQLLLLVREPSPQDEDHSAALSTDQLDTRVRELLPTDMTVRIRLVRSAKNHNLRHICERSCSF